jgi:hypothetical protein
MKVIVSVQPRRASSRGLVHYIAHSKLDAAREPAGREIFNERADELSARKASEFLKKEITPKRVSNDELHHLVISLKAEDFERLGNDEPERRNSLKEITRHAMKRLENELGADGLNWAAGVHRNTENPHVHIAIQKEYFDRDLEKKVLSKIPVSVLPRYEKNEAGQKVLAPGSLIESATEKLDLILRTKGRSPDAPKEKSQTDSHQNRPAYNAQENNEKGSEIPDNSDSTSKPEIERERDVLARAILAKYHLEKTRENLDALVNHGDRRRFRIFDEIGQTKRSISLFDLERRAEKRAAGMMEREDITDPLKKEELKKTLVEDELKKNLGGIKRIKTILHNLVVKETIELRKREDDYKTVKPLAEKIRHEYRKESKKLPVPNLTREQVEMLQTEALEKKDFRAADYFERVRSELFRERGVPTRTKEELRRLKARKTLSELKVLFQEKQLKTFGERKRHFPVELDGKKWTLSGAQELIEKQALDYRKPTAKISRALGKIGLIERKYELAKFEEIKNRIFEKLSEKQESLSQEITREKSLLKTLDGFYEKAVDPEKETLEAKFTAKELEQIESLAFELKLPEVYRENWSHQKQFIEGSEENKEKSAPETKQKAIAGRALARRILSEIEVARCREEFNDFLRRKDFTKFEAANKKTGEATFVSLSEVGFDSRGSIFDQTLEYFLENREKRDTRRQLEKSVKEKRIELKNGLRDAKAISKTASEEARDFQTRSIFGTVKFLHEPLFTPKELMTIELRIDRTTSKSEAKNLQKILDAADHSKAKSLSVILSGSTSEGERAERAETLFESSLNKANSAEKAELKSAPERFDDRENKTEILNQDRGR